MIHKNFNLFYSVGNRQCFDANLDPTLKLSLEGRVYNTAGLQEISFKLFNAVLMKYLCNLQQNGQFQNCWIRWLSFSGQDRETLDPNPSTWIRFDRIRISNTGLQRKTHCCGSGSALFLVGWIRKKRSINALNWTFFITFSFKCRYVCQRCN
jgi:hypothetical protein